MDQVMTIITQPNKVFNLIIHPIFVYLYACKPPFHFEWSKCEGIHQTFLAHIEQLTSLPRRLPTAEQALEQYLPSPRFTWAGLT